MTTGYDVSAIVPCTGCGQPLPQHLSMCPAVPPAGAAGPAEIPAETIEQVNDMEHKLGEAV
jgi:hypothetical protein